MNFRSVLLVSVLSLAPLTASAAIDIDGPGDGDGGGGTGGGGGGETPPPPDWSKSYAKSALFGSQSWGAGYSITGSMTARRADATHRDRLSAAMSAETYAKINGGRYRLFSARVTGNTEAKARTDLAFNAYVGPATVYTKSYTSLTSTYTLTNLPQMTWATTFFDFSTTISLIVPITFKVKSTGELKANLTGKISNAGIEAGATPSGKASLYASAAIGGQYCVLGACVGASAGVYSDVTLVQAAAPATASVFWSLSKWGGVVLTYLGRADLTLSTLDGELGLYAEACLGACISDSVKLIEWDGFSASYNLFNQSGTYCLAGTCTLTTSPGTVGMSL